MRRLDVSCPVDVSEVYVASVFRVEVCMVSERSVGPENGVSVYLPNGGSTHLACYDFFQF
jgi:hypothetical protein